MGARPVGVERAVDGVPQARQRRDLAPQPRDLGPAVAFAVQRRRRRRPAVLLLAEDGVEDRVDAVEVLFFRAGVGVQVVSDERAERARCWRVFFRRQSWVLRLGRRRDSRERIEGVETARRGLGGVGAAAVAVVGEGRGGRRLGAVVRGLNAYRGRRGRRRVVSRRLGAVVLGQGKIVVRGVLAGGFGRSYVARRRNDTLR